MIVVNGEQRQIEAGTTVAALVAGLGMPPRGVAVALDGEVVRRGEWERMALRDGQSVEVVAAIQGG